VARRRAGVDAPRSRSAALLYHFGTRRLSFLKNQTVLAVVRSLADYPSARSACAAAGVPDADLPATLAPWRRCADSRMITERPALPNGWRYDDHPRRCLGQRDTPRPFGRPV